VSIAVDGGKSLSGLFEGWAKARVQTSPSATRSATPGEWFDVAHHKFLSGELFLLVLCFLAVQKAKNTIGLK